MLTTLLVLVIVLLSVFIVATLLRYESLVKRSTEREAALASQNALSGKAALADRSQLTAILSASEDAILLVDRDGVCKTLNSKAEMLFPASGLNTLVGLTQSAELDGLLNIARQSNRDEPSMMGEVVLRPQGDKTMQVLMTHVGEFGDDNVSYLIMLRDITDLRRLETIRRDFVANVSHELRTPLTSVKAMAETLLNGALEDPGFARHFLETIVRETDRLVRLAADLLDLSRIETHAVHKSDQDIAKLVDDISTRLETQRIEAGLMLSMSIDRPLVAPCDPDEIAQVLVNLIDNAIKYTSRGGKITIYGEARDSSIIIEVSDTGIGILKQDLPRLFERFYRTDKARGRQSGGTGLGLSIVKHIVERHGGELWVRSEYNRGTTFGFSLPRTANSLTISAKSAEGLRMDNDIADYVVVTNENTSDAA